MISRRETTQAITELLSHFANPHHPALEREELRPRLYGSTGVMVDEYHKGDPKLTQFAFFLMNTEAKLVRFVWNIETFNRHPKAYVTNALKGLGEGWQAAAENEIEQVFGGGRVLH